MMMLSIFFIHWLLFDLPGVFGCLVYWITVTITCTCMMFCIVAFLVLDWCSIPSLLWKVTREKVKCPTIINRKRVFKRRTIVLIRRKVVITMLETSLSMTSNLVSILLQMSGDVELNPGPGKIVYDACYSGLYTRILNHPGLNYDVVDSTNILGML